MDAGRDLIYGEGAGHGRHVRRRPADGLRRHHLRRPRRGHPAGRRPEPARPAAAEDPDDDARLGPRIESRAYQNGGDDTIFGNLGRDVDRRRRRQRHGSTATRQDDLVFGDHVFLIRRVVETGADRHRLRRPATSPAAASRRSAAPALQPHRPARTPARRPGRRRRQRAAQLLVDGVARRLPRPGQPGRRRVPVVGRVRASTSTTTTRRTTSTTSTSDAGTDGRRQLRQRLHRRRPGQRPDLRPARQRHRSRATAASSDAFARRSTTTTVPRRTPARSRTPDGCTGVGRRTSSATTSATSTSSRRSRRATDGEDYIEGNGGNDIVFGGLGQDDIVGGSSDFFSLTHAATSGPTAADLHLRRRRHCTSTATTTATRRATATRRRPPTGHARDADTIVGDNGRHHPHRRHQPRRRDHRRVDRADSQVRHVQLRQLRRDASSSSAASRCSTTRRAARTSDPERLRPRHAAGLQRLAGAAASCCDAAADAARGTAGNGTTHVDIGGRDEIHGEAGDDTVYGGGGNDVVYGDAQDDDLIGGWGNDWISGGTGQDGVLGDDGRIFTSRNTAARRDLGSVHRVQRAALRHRKFLHRSIRTRRRARATCSTSSSTRRARSRRRRSTSRGALKKAVDLTPFNLDAERDIGHQIDAALRRQQLRRHHLRRLGRRLPARRRPATTRSPAPRRCATSYVQLYRTRDCRQR